MPSLMRRVVRRIRGGDWTAEELHDYWRDPSDEGNRAESYTAEETLARSRFLVSLVEGLVDHDGRLLEVGCNVGRNLNTLMDAGFRQVSGIEISARALELMRRHYPQVAEGATIHNRPVEEVAPELEDGEFDVVFTVAVLEHIHPSSEWVFAELARAARVGLVTMEDERGQTWRHFPRNYREVFEGVGLKQVDERPLGPAEGLEEGFVARVFRRA